MVIFFGPDHSPGKMKERDKRNIWKREMKQNYDGRKWRRKRKHIIKERRNSEKNSE